MKSRILVATIVVVSIVVSQSLRAASETAVGKDLKCPVTGKAVDTANPHAKAQFNGGTVYFCCEKCPKAFSSDTQKYAAKANLQLAQSGQIVEVGCPLSGKALNPATAVDVQGVKVAFCCNVCKGKVAKASADDKVKMIFTNTTKGYKAASAAGK